MSASILNNFHVVILGETSLNTGQVTMLTNWVNAGGNLIAMRPDKKLASLLGLDGRPARRSRTRTCGQHDRRTPGAGIVGDHAVPRNLRPVPRSGATTVATLYSTRRRPL